MIIKLRVKTNSGRQEIEKISENEYKVWLKSTPEDGKANGELLRFLKKYFGKEVRIKTGFSSRKKVVEVGSD